MTRLLCVLGLLAMPSLTKAATPQAPPIHRPYAAEMVELPTFTETNPQDNLDWFLKKFDEEAAKHKTVTVSFRSDGGRLSIGFAAIAHMNETKAKYGTWVQCVNDDRALSMAFVIFESPACDERIGTLGNVYMAHQSWVQLDGGYNAHTLLAMAKELGEKDRAIEAIILARVHVTAAEYEANTAYSDWAFGTIGASDVGAIDFVEDHTNLPKRTLIPGKIK